ncbi:GAF domain-containing protein [Arthrobacter sp. MDT3-24]
MAGGQPGRAAAGGWAGVLRRAGWSETGFGINAIGEALVTGRPVQLFSAEHLVRPHQEWACMAAPITDPATGRLLGVLDVSGPLNTLSADTLRMVRCAVRVAETLLGTPDGGEAVGFPIQPVHRVPPSK